VTNGHFKFQKFLMPFLAAECLAASVVSNGCETKLNDRRVGQRREWPAVATTASPACSGGNGGRETANHV
jgi:hypothetical protein